MIEIKSLRALRGPNRYTKHTVIIMPLDIHDYEHQPTDTLDGFTERLISLIPSLQEHRCSVGERGGFIKRLKRGTWAGHVIEHIAIELQCLAGIEVGFGKTFTMKDKGVYVVVFRYLVESVGLNAAASAVTIFESIAEGKIIDLDSLITELKILKENDELGPTTLSIVNEAESRDIPCIRLNSDSYIQLGFGKYQRTIQAAMSCQTSAIAVEIADEKTRTKSHLKKSGVPVPQGYVVSTEEEAIKAFHSIGSSVVVKPNIGNHGKGSTINVTTDDQIKLAFDTAKIKCRNVIVEEYIEGFDFRFLIIAGKLVAAALRDPAHVVGDGLLSIKKLIDKTNYDPCRGEGHEKALTRIEINKEMEEFLSRINYTLSSTPVCGEKVYLTSLGNLSQGATSTDVTDIVSPSVKLMAERAARIIGLDCAGVDIIAQNISLSLEQSGSRVVEVNAAPGFRMHLNPTHGKARSVAKPFVDMIFKEGYIPVPVIAVTGTNGKTTTCKLIAHALKYSGKCVGLACTTGVEINGVLILSGDYSGPEGAGIVIREKSVDHIVLEAARGGIVRRGLGVNKLDVGILLNIGEDHLGKDWIETQEDLSLVKSTVLETVSKSGVSVLNADDSVVMSLIDRAKGNVILFSSIENNPHIKHYTESGIVLVTVVDRVVVIRKDGFDLKICTLDNIPISFGGIVQFNVSNALAAIAALYGLGLPIEHIKKGVETFYPSVSHNPGRMNFFDFEEYKVLFDFGHNSESAHAMAELLPQLTPGRKVGVCHGTGSRTDEQIIGYGQALALVYDYIFLCDLDPCSRPHGETIMLVFEGLRIAGFNKKNIRILNDSNNVIDDVFSQVRKGDFVVIHPNKLEPLLSNIIERHAEWRNNISLELSPCTAVNPAEI